jgi:KDO2-lipid IV(A) lauroyltransferase
MNSLLNWFVKILLMPLAYGPRSLQILAGRILGILWFDIVRFRRQLILENFRKAFPDWSEGQVRRYARLSMTHLGLTIIEFVLFPFFKKSWLETYIKFEGLEILQRYKDQNQGVLLLGCHLSNGDLGLMGLAYKDFPVHLISKKFKNKKLNDVWFSLRSRHGTAFIEDRKSSFDILRALRHGGRVVFVMDQFTGRPLGIKSRFFNIETGTASGLALFAERTKAPVVPAYTYRDESFKTIVCIEEPISIVKGDSTEQTIQLTTQKYNDVIEQIVRKYPAQWMWVHNRWKKFRE